MKRRSLKVLSLVAVLATAGLVVAQNTDNETTLNRIAAYRHWTRVNPKPVEVPIPLVVTTATVDLRTMNVGV
jgi:hypothetical protein